MIEPAGRADLRSRPARRFALVSRRASMLPGRGIERVSSSAGGTAAGIVAEFATVASVTSAASPLVVVQQRMLAKRGIYPRSGKRLLDILGAAVLLVIAAPIMLVVAGAVRIGLGRRVVYRQRRVGLHGRYFTVYKFRTMRADRRAEGLPFMGSDRRLCHKTHADPRLTALGRFLRKWSLDELPQLWNVVRGEMSLVGPRPELISIVEAYEPWQLGRHLVKPGLTGYWQIYARGGSTLMHTHTKLDIAYVRDIGLLTDLKVLLLTLPAIVGMHKGY